MSRGFLAVLIIAITTGLAIVLVFSMPDTFVGSNTPSRAKPGEAIAYFAGGCFWCTEADFQKILGVNEVISGYSGGHLDQPKYEDVTKETTGHRESVEVHYDPSLVNYRQLVEYFFDHIDPTDSGGQFHDRGESYTSAIFYQTDEEARTAKAVVQELTNNHIYSQPIATAILPFKNFFPAEEYHQNYSERNPIRYGYYRAASGRDALTHQVCQIKTQKHIPCFSGKFKPNP